MLIEKNGFCNCKKINFAGIYKGRQNVTSSVDGINSIVTIEKLILTITKVNGSVDAYNLHYKFDNRPDINGLGNVIDNKLIIIVPSSTYNYFEKRNNKLFQKFVGINNDIYLSGTGILYKQRV